MEDVREVENLKNTIARVAAACKEEVGVENLDLIRIKVYLEDYQRLKSTVIDYFTKGERITASLKSLVGLESPFGNDQHS